MYALNNVTYFESFGVECIPKEIKKFIGNRNIQAIVFRIRANNSVMCGYFCIEFIGFLLKNKNLTDFAHLFSPSDLKKNDDMVMGGWNRWEGFIYIRM